MASKSSNMEDEGIHRTLRDRGHAKQIRRFSSHG